VKLTLYGTSACHLCEIAEQMLTECQGGGIPLAYEKVDISDSDALFERYGERIPVVRDEVGRELGWPFQTAGLTAWLAK
jgi:glutaredoxin